MKQSGTTWEGINLRRVILWMVMIILCALAILSCASVAKRFCKVGVIEIEGEGRYSEEALLEGLRLGENDWLYELDSDAIKERMLKEFPFLLDMELIPVFPNRLRVVVTERFTPWYIAISGGTYALNENLLVIDEIDSTEGMTRLILPSVQRVIAGSVPAFAEDENELRRTLEIIDILRSSSYFDRMSEVNVEDRRNIRLVVDGIFTVKLGNAEELSYKLEQVGEVLKSDRLAGAESGQITAENPDLPVAVSVKMPPAAEEDTESNSQ